MGPPSLRLGTRYYTFVLADDHGWRDRGVSYNYIYFENQADISSKSPKGGISCAQPDPLLGVLGDVLWCIVRICTGEAPIVLSLLLCPCMKLPRKTFGKAGHECVPGNTMPAASLLHT